MKTQLVITDLTRMQFGRVCIAGYNHKKQCIRPIVKGGIPESVLFQDGKLIVYPFALIELDLLDPKPQPPHTEDINFNLYTLSFVRQVYSREEVLKWSLFDSVANLFEQPVLSGPGHYVLECQGARSLGTIQPSEITQVIYEPGEDGVWDYRLAFLDQSGAAYRLKIVDLSWHYYCNSLRDERHQPTEIALILNERLRNSKIYLRIGLARGWKLYPERCYLQITGIYSFPDYTNETPLQTFWKLPK
jgi:hypothetical protein